MSVTFKFDVPEIMGKIEAANQEALVELGNDIIADSNKLAPWGEGDLIASAINNSDLKNGVIVWDTPYAQYLYYGVVMVGEKSHNPWAKRGEKKVVKDPEQILYFSGSGKIEITPQHNAVCPFFKHSGEGGDNGNILIGYVYAPAPWCEIMSGEKFEQEETT